MKLGTKTALAGREIFLKKFKALGGTVFQKVAK